MDQMDQSLGTGWGLGLEGENLGFSQAFFFICALLKTQILGRENLFDQGVTSSGSPCNGGWEVLERKFEALLLYTQWCVGTSLHWLMIAYVHNSFQLHAKGHLRRGLKVAVLGVLYDGSGQIIHVRPFISREPVVRHLLTHHCLD